MPLIKSISGIRGTIGGPAGDNLNPLDIVKFTAAYATFIRRSTEAETEYKPTRRIVVGRDARISGRMVLNIVCGTLVGMGYDVVNIGLASTPTTEIAVTAAHADGGIIITASHNPRHWNALKLLNRHGEFLTKADGNEVLAIAERGGFDFADVDHLGVCTEENYDFYHISSVLELPYVDVEAIRRRHFRVCVDSINSVGGLILPRLLNSLGVEHTFLNKEADGDFRHNPEPLEKNLYEIMDEMRTGKYDLGIVVDPDVDRLAFISEDGTMFGEEYTLVAVAEHVLSSMAGEEGHPALNTVSNLSSTRALRDVTERHGGTYTASAVGEVNVTTLMKKAGAVIGGEGNGGVIYPASHYGRDALVGISLFLTMLAKRNTTPTALRRTLPEYFIAKNRIDLKPETDIDAILESVKQRYAKDPQVAVNDIDGVKLDFPDRWVHLRRSNTEPIIRVYSEAHTMAEAEALAHEIMAMVRV